MLLMTRRPSATMAGIALNWELSSTNLCNLRGSLTAGGHGDSAVGILQRQHVIDTVARHGDRMALLLEGADKHSASAPA